MDLIEIITEEILTDTGNIEKESKLLIQCYKKSSKKEKKRIDLCFIALCGWSLDTLIKKMGGE